MHVDEARSPVHRGADEWQEACANVAAAREERRKLHE